MAVERVAFVTPTVLNLVGGVVLLALGLWVLSVKPRRGPNVALAVFTLALGARFAVGNLMNVSAADLGPYAGRSLGRLRGRRAVGRDAPRGHRGLRGRAHRAHSPDASRSHPPRMHHGRRRPRAGAIPEDDAHRIEREASADTLA